MCALTKCVPFAASTASRVLECLMAAPDTFVSGSAIAATLGMSRVAIWKHIRALRAQGCRVDACRNRGYRLVGKPDLPTHDAVRAFLHTQKMGRALLFFREAQSTNLLLGQQAAAGAAEGLVVVADHQTAGRGRMGRSWFSPAGVNLYCSILLRPMVGLDRVATLPLVVGLAVARALETVAPGLGVAIKWPNDLHTGGRKIGGILCEMASEPDGVSHVVVGIGINVNLCRSRLPRALSGLATSLTMETRRTFSRAELLANLLDALETFYSTWCAQGLAPFLPDLASRDALKGRTVQIEQGGHHVAGKADGIQADGTLALRQPDGSCLSVCSGEVHLTGLDADEAAAASAPAASRQKKNPTLPYRRNL